LFNQYNKTLESISLEFEIDYYNQLLE